MWGQGREFKRGRERKRAAPSFAAWQAARALVRLALAAAAVRGAGAQYCPAGAAQAACAAVLVVCANDQALCEDVQSRLRGTGAFAAVSTRDGGYGGTLTLAELAAHDAVLVYGGPFLDAALLGDRLAAYHDGGGGVVVAYPANFNIDSSPNNRLKGAFGAPASGYALLDYAQGTVVPGADSLGDVLDPQSPLMAGVASLSASSAYRSTAPVIPGRGAVVARWRGGGQEPLVVRGARGNRTLVELNFYPPSSSAGARTDLWTGDGAALMRNALKYSRCMQCGPGTFAAAGADGREGGRRRAERGRSRMRAWGSLFPPFFPCVVPQGKAGLWPLVCGTMAHPI
jgi:hypothetical protein